MGATNRRLAGFFTATNLIDFAHRRYRNMISQLFQCDQFYRYVGGIACFRAAENTVIYGSINNQSLRRWMPWKS